MKHHTRFTLAVLFSSLVGLVTFDFGPLAASAQAQRANGDGQRDDRGRDGEGERRGEGRPRGIPGRGGDWGGRRRGPRGENGGGGPEETVRRPENSERDRNRDIDDRSTMDTTEWAKSFVRQHDKNNNMMLEGDELRDLRGPTASADRNDDKTITVNELVASAAERGGANRGRRDRNAEPGRSSGDEQGAANSSAAAKATRVYAGSVAGTRTTEKKETDKRRTYRFTPPADRLPTGLPSWFKSRDRNSDGQVAMSEYTRSWSQRMVSEFRRYDRNDDGVVTPKEAAK